MGFTPLETPIAMFGANIALNHDVSRARCNDFLVEAERQRSVDIALRAHAQSHRVRFAAGRATLATLLLRAGSWLMPEETPEGCINPAHCALELRPGQ